MAIGKFETYTEGKRDQDGYLILHDSLLCPRCGKLSNLKFIKDAERRHHCQLLGYCERCHQQVMGW